MGSSYGDLNTVSGERLQVIRGSGDIQIVITTPGGQEMRLRLALNETRQLSNLLREAAEVEQNILDSTQSG